MGFAPLTLILVDGRTHPPTAFLSRCFSERGFFYSACRAAGYATFSLPYSLLLGNLHHPGVRDCLRGSHTGRCFCEGSAVLSFSPGNGFTCRFRMRKWASFFHFLPRMMVALSFPFWLGHPLFRVRSRYFRGFPYGAKKFLFA